MQILFYISAFLSVVAALGVVFMPKPLYSALCLITNMLLLAGLFAMQEAHFLATAQIIVYAGAIMVLVVFLIMLLSIDSKEHKPVGIGAGALAIISVFGFLYVLIPALQDHFSGALLWNAQVTGEVRQVGMLLYTKYVFAFEVASMLIMVAVVGAVMLAKKPKVGAEMLESKEGAS